LNPFSAPHILQGIFHRGFQETHQVAGQLLGYARVAVFRGDGGEIERRPNKPTEVFTCNEGVLGQEIWPTLIADPVQPEDTEMDVQRLAAVWSGAEKDSYAAAAITGTVAIALKLMDRAPDKEKCDGLARAMWEGRDKDHMWLAAKKAISQEAL